MNGRPMDQCPYCGATRCGGFGGPHVVHPCPMKQREHEQRLEHERIEHEARLAAIVNVSSLERIAELAETLPGRDAAEGRALGEIAELARQRLRPCAPS